MDEYQLKHDGNGLVQMIEHGEVVAERQFDSVDEAEAFMSQVALGVLP